MRLFGVKVPQGLADCILNKAVGTREEGADKLGASASMAEISSDILGR